MPPSADTLAAARAGDSASFAALVRPYERELRAHCYRMTGSLAEADDVVQESLLRAWRGIGGFEGRSSFRTWLYRIATHAALNHLASRAGRGLPSDHGTPAGAGGLEPPGDDPIWLEPAPDWAWTTLPAAADARLSARESVGLAFLCALQALPPLQRGVLLLRDVLGWSAADCAEALDTSVAAVHSALQRARATLEARQDRRLQSLDPADAATRALLDRYVAAWETGDPHALAALLRDDAVLTMPPVPTWFAGRQSIEAFVGAIWPTMGTFRLRIVPIAGGLGLAAWVRPPGGTVFVANTLHVLSGGPDGLSRLDIFMNPGNFADFGLPAQLS